ncbi:MAG: phosphatidate cytidylyltransferase [Saccharofermentans sp.]|nr:phosphatidate cytidylyltransferase [Saccharofermentans sp.]
MRQRVITGILFTIGVLAFVVPSLWIPYMMIPFCLIVGGVSIYEMIKAYKAGDIGASKNLIISGALLSVLILIASIILELDLFQSLVLYSILIMLYCFAVAVIPSIACKDGLRIKEGVYTAATVLYITFPLYCLAAVSILVENGWYFMVPSLFAAWISDVCAYFSGVTLGKHKIVPHISPKKTWEGCIGGALGCAIIVMIYFDVVIGNVVGINANIVLMSLVGFLLGFLMSVMSQLGDWLASLIKRAVGIKDYGNIFPGHGGMMDRFDSTFFTIPTGILLALFSLILV